MNLYKLFRGRLRPCGFDHRRLLATPSERRPVRACALVALAAAALLAGCNNYNLNLGAAPTLTSQLSYLAPNGKVAGGSSFTLTVNGAGFVDGSTVQWNGSGRDTTFVSSTVLTATITSADIASAGTFSISVMSPGTTTNGNNMSNFLPFNVYPSSSSATDSTAAAKASVAELPGNNYTPAITTGHRYVAFAAVSADPSADASTGMTKIYLRDTCAGAPAGCTPRTVLVSAGPGGAQPDGASRSPSVSADGRFVTFASDATNLVADDTNGVTDVFLRDTCIGAPAGCVPQTTRISLAADGTEANGPSDSPSISADGRFIAFDSAAGNLVLDGSSTPTGAFLRDTCFGAPDGCVPATTRLAISPPPQ